MESDGFRYAFKVIGFESKRIVSILAEVLGLEATYAGVPTYAYKVGGWTMDREPSREIAGGDEILAKARETWVEGLPRPRKQEIAKQSPRDIMTVVANREFQIADRKIFLGGSARNFNIGPPRSSQFSAAVLPCAQQAENCGQIFELKSARFLTKFKISVSKMRRFSASKRGTQYNTFSGWFALPIPWIPITRITTWETAMQPAMPEPWIHVVISFYP